MARDLHDIARQLGHELGPLRRAVSRATRAAEGLPDLPDNQIEVLRAVVANPGIGTSAIAARLQLARPTVSNLLATMKRAGLLELTRPRDDGRLVEVFATEAAVELLDHFDRVSAEIIAGALTELPADQVTALQEAMPALVRMNDVLRPTEPAC
jgi:DNA-binding MarR family transcriptional regulator